VAIFSSIKNFIRAVKKHNKHVNKRANAGRDTARYQQRIDHRRQAYDTANQNLANANNSLNLATANINATKTKIRGIDNQLGSIDKDIQTQMQILSNPQSKKKARNAAQAELQRLFNQQQTLKSQRKNFKSDLNKYKGNRNTARGDVQTATQAQTQANANLNRATDSYNNYINSMHNYQDPGLGVRAAARVIRDPASLVTEPLKYGVPLGAGYLYATGSANTENTLNKHYNAPQNTAGVTPDDEYGAAAQNNAEPASAYIPVRNPSATYPSYAPAPGTIQDVPEDQWAAFAPPGPLVMGNPTEQYSAFAPGPDHLPDVPQDEWDNYAPPQITNPLKEAMRIQLERERQAQATK
jgi:predicted  nucleic acid-binding Zn-ribbon protein